MLVSLIQMAMGVVILSAGSEIAVRGAVMLARSLKFPASFIRFVLVGYGLSAPELMVGMQAASTGSPDIALGVVIGSNLVNLLLLLGGTALFAAMSTGDDTALIKREGGIMTASAFLLLTLALDGEISRADGLMLLFALAGYTFYALRKRTHEADEPAPGKPCNWCAVSYVLVGLGMLLMGADILVDGAVAFAHRMHLAEAAVGLTLVALGTSVPELVTSLYAARHKQKPLDLGALLSSCIFNLLGITGIAALFTPIPVADRFLAVDFFALIAASLIFMAFLLSGRRVSRREGMVFLALYAAYALYLFCFGAAAPISH